MEPKQEKFCIEYLVDLNGTQAAIRAGYSKRSATVTAARMLTKANIQEKIRELKDAQEKRTLVTADFVITGLKTIAERCMQGEEVRDKDGNPTGEWEFDSSGANRAFELLGKHLNLFKESVDLNIKTYEHFKKMKEKYGFEQ